MAAGNRIRGIRSPIPQGYVLANVAGGNQQLVAIADLLAQGPAGAGAIVAAGGGGSSTLISTQTANNTATSLAWAGLSGYSYYDLVVANLLPATDGVHFGLQFGFGGTPTWDTSAAHHYSSNQVKDDGTGATNGSSTLAYVQINAFAGNAGGGMSGRMTITTDANDHFVVGSTYGRTSVGGSSVYFSWMFTGFLHHVAALTAIRIISDSGNINTGKASLYGVSS
jgi:hypothetical protein